MITLTNCSLLWVSKLQTTIALSTMQAEYQALSTCCCDLIPLYHLIQDASAALNNSYPIMSFLTLWSKKIIVPASIKSWCQKWLPRPNIWQSCTTGFQQSQIIKINTTANPADILTKGLVADRFTAIHRLLCDFWLIFTAEMESCKNIYTCLSLSLSVLFLPKQLVLLSFSTSISTSRLMFAHIDNDST
jgi:hypothetical protein